MYLCVFVFVLMYWQYMQAGQCRSKCNEVSLALPVTQAWLKIASSSEGTKERIRRGALSNCTGTSHSTCVWVSSTAAEESEPFRGLGLKRPEEA